MYISVITITDENGEYQNSWEVFDTLDEAKTHYESSLENPQLYTASYGGVIKSTNYPSAE